MNIKNSIVKGVQSNGTYESKNYGLFYKYEVTFENGDSGEYSSKSDNQNKFIQGQEAYYLAEQNANGYWRIKPQNAEFAQNNPQATSKGLSQSNPSANTTFSREELIIRQNALGHAVSLWQGGALSVEDIEDRAGKFAEWVLRGSEVQAKHDMLDKAGFDNATTKETAKQIDDLPF
tara:strand:+ start:693 stop:1220 length:528 start_codon:yes stop_codon:yes gene_type:complete